MANVLIAGLVNVETTLKVRGFPIEYYPIDYPFFGVQSGVSGVGYNLACALQSLGDSVKLTSMIGQDFQGAYIRDTLGKCQIPSENLLPLLEQTPTSVILYEESGRRQVWCDLKDIQQRSFPFAPEMLQDIDVVAACNINFSRPLLRLAKAAGKKIATDVHVLGDIHDAYNQEFLQYADILFLSDEAVGENYHSFLRALYDVYHTPVIVLGRGSEGAALCESGCVISLPAVQVGPVVNTVGAGDALFSAFLHYHSKGYCSLEALKRAQIFASAKITANGGAAGFVTEAQIEEYYCRYAAEMKPF